MHVHQSIWKDGKNLFAGNGYAGLSEMALFYIGGIIKHAKALNAITNPGTNSYKRLVPHYEAPVKLAYSAKNRSASIRIPHVASDKARRIETRFPDPIANPYLCFAALLMAGLDGIQNKIHPGDPADKNLYDLPPEEDAKIPTVCASLEEALAALDKDREFLTRGGVFSNDWIDAFIELKMDEVNKVRMTTHPVEFDLYYSCKIEFWPIDQQIKATREERLVEQQHASRELIRNLVHEIKNPLGGIRGAAQLLERELNNPGLREYTQVIIKEADRLQDLMRRLLSPHRPMQPGPVNIHEILERVRSLLTAEFPTIAPASTAITTPACRN
jgi:hypothetical protein